MRKSRLTKLIAIVLSLTLAFASFGAVTASATSAYPIISGDSDNPIGVIFSDIIDTLLKFILNLFSGLFDDGPGFVPSDDAYDKAAQNYYEGTGTEFKTSADDDAQWNLGYANTSLIPDDYSNGTYYIGGYIAIENGFSNVVEGIAEIPGIGKDDMKARCVAINDGTDNGTVLFATIDCIGITNADIKDIRARLADFAAANNIVAINVSSTHTHSCIDTEGLWTKLLYKLARNGIISGTDKDEELIQGTNPAYMEFLKDSVADALMNAYADMQPGVLTYTEKDLGQDYFNNKNRPSSGEMIYEINENGDKVYTGEKEIAMTDISRFIFIPDDETATPTMMLNIAAHPDVAGLPTESNSGREISGDYLFYCGKFLEDAGYNFMFFQGAIAGIYMSRSVTGDGVPTEQRVEESQRYGYELARMALALTMTEEEIKADPILSNAAEVAENTELVSIYDEEGYLKQEFKDYGMTPAYYTIYNLVADSDTIPVYTINEDDAANIKFTIVADEVTNTISIKNGNYTVIKNEYGEGFAVSAMPLQGFAGAVDEDGNLVALYIDEAIADAKLSEDGSLYEILFNNSSLVEVDMTGRTIESEEQKLTVARNGKVFVGEVMPINPDYSVWYENWNCDAIPEEKEVEPFLNLLIKQVEIPVSNALIEAVGKLNMANYIVIANEDGSYSTITEIGYMEMGNQFKTVFLPGEICQDLVAPNGASLNAQYSVTAKPFASQPACAIFGEDVKCFGLMNDAIGYVVPDNDYTMGDPVNHYHELISLGQGVASALMDGLQELNASIVRV